jgi:signal transduction histidine kinase
MHATRISNRPEPYQRQAYETQAHETQGHGTRGRAPIAAAGGRDARGSALRRVGLPRSRAMRYGLTLLLVAAAYATALLLEAETGKFAAFPFYAAVVAGAWLGIGPGLLCLVLSAVAAADFWTPGRYSINIATIESPSFLAFVVFALMSLAWSMQRRRAENALEATVQQRTAELVRANAALKAEIAERSAAERALRDAEAELAGTLRLAAMAELAATIAHEINQPLAAITANGSACLRSLQRDPPLLDTAREAAGCIVADGHRAGDVIARIRALFNKGPQQRQAINLNEIVDAVLALMRDAIERQRVAVRLEPAIPPPLVAADPVQLQQVLVNLVTNALEAMQAVPEGGRLLTIRTRTLDETAAVSVEDTGVGIDPERVGHIFDSFYTTKAGGIGVGLAISRSIIEAHGGSMWAAPGTPAPGTPAPGTPTGAVVGFDLPLAVPQDQTADDRTAESETTRGENAGDQAERAPG